MNKTFDHALACTLFHEGGYSDHAADPGGTTMFGISLRFLRSHGLLYDVDQDGDVDQDDLMAIAADRVKVREFYHRHFWQPAQLDRIYSMALKVKMFDTAVNTGVARAVSLLQGSMVRLGLAPSNFAVDGRIGPATIALVNQYQATDYLIINKYRELQLDFYLKLIESKPSLAVFRLGWSRRAAT